MSAAEVRVGIKPTTEIETRGAYLDIGEDVTIAFGDTWRPDWRRSALEAIDHLTERLDTLRGQIGEDLAVRRGVPEYREPGL